MTPSSALAVGDVARYGDVATILRSAADPKSVPTFVDRAPLDGKAKARATAQDFEAVFLNSMFQHMFAGLDGEGPFGGSGAAGVWRSFLSEEYAKSSKCPLTISPINGCSTIQLPPGAKNSGLNES